MTLTLAQHKELRERPYRLTTICGDRRRQAAQAPAARILLAGPWAPSEHPLCAGRAEDRDPHRPDLCRLPPAVAAAGRTRRRGRLDGQVLVQWPAVQGGRCQGAAAWGKRLHGGGADRAGVRRRARSGSMAAPTRSWRSSSRATS